MPSPFPGMDPYLEGSEWSSVHTELSTEIARQLAPKLRPKYIVRTTQRFVTDMPESVSITSGDIYPDIGVFDAMRQGGTVEGKVVVAAPPLEMATVVASSIPLLTVEIRDVAERHHSLREALIPQIDIETTLQRLYTFQAQIEKGLLAADADFQARRQLMAYLQVRGMLKVEEEEKVLYLTCIIDPKGKKLALDPELFSLVHEAS